MSIDLAIRQTSGTVQVDLSRTPWTDAIGRPVSVTTDPALFFDAPGTSQNQIQLLNLIGTGSSG